MQQISLTICPYQVKHGVRAIAALENSAMNRNADNRRKAYTVETRLRKRIVDGQRDSPQVLLFRLAK
jgi:hypothetical protein